MRRAAAGLLVAATLAACSGDDGDDDGASTSATTTTTEAPATSSTSTPTSTTVPAPTDAGCPPVEAPLAAVDLDGDGVEERWRSAGSGAAADIVELVVVDACDEVPVAQFAVGGSVRELHGLRCEDAAVVELVATSVDGGTYATTEVRHELVGAALVEAGRSAGELPGTDPALAAFTTFDC